jgi:IS30 family transposase
VGSVIGLKIRNRAERQQIGFELHAEGLTNRAIADVLGVHHSTVDNDLNGGNPPDNEHFSEQADEDEIDEEDGCLQLR